MKLNEALRTENLSEFPTAKLYIDGSDAALFYQDATHCFAAFDSTTASDIMDWLKNIDPTVGRICALDNASDCCSARKGFKAAYSHPSYKTNLENDVLTCMNEGKEVVLTGHSAGGATAAVAAVALRETNPTIITFGQPASIVGDCPVINEDKYYRFVNTDVNQRNNLDYDPVPSLTFTIGSLQLGNLFLVCDDVNNVVHFGSGNTPSIINWGFDPEAHEAPRYLARLVKYQGKGDLGTNGWATGFACNLDEECDSGQCAGWPWYWSSGKCR